MRVPLSAYRVVQNDTQFVDVWANGRRRREPAPFLPYTYAKEREPGGFSREERVVVRPLSTLEEEPWWRYSYPTVNGVSALNRAEHPILRPDSFASGVSLADSHVPFIERVLIDEPGWFAQFPNTDPVRFLTLDIEQLTSGEGFPTGKDPLISIGWAANDGEPEVVLGDGKDDRGILRAFLDAVTRIDPDVIVGYNVDGYDLPMILKRLAENGLPRDALGRGGDPVRGGGDDDDDEDLVLPGRLIYDVYDSVKADQTLYGIKDLKLKTVGAWMRYSVVKEDTRDTRTLVGTDRLRTYNASDVILTRNLANIYFPNYEALADFYGAPLGLAMRAQPSFHTTILQGRVFRGLNIVSDGRNDERHSGLYAQADGQAFVGGIVEIYQRGLFTPIWKVDFSSMYPSIMVSLGCGADNTRFLGTEPKGAFAMRTQGDRRIYSIPDDSRNVNLIVEIRGISPLAEEIRRLLAERMVLKKRAKEAPPDERTRLNARQNAIKVILNSIYGVMASAHARYGSLAVAVATVGVARRLIRVVEEHLGDAKIETDTDGVYNARPVDADAVNGVVRRFVEDELGGEAHTRVEVEDYQAGYFHQRKSYILLHHDGRVEKHGIAFKGSSLCGVFDKTLDRVSRALLTGKDDPRAVGRACFDLAQFDDQDFVMRVRLGKSFEDYKAGSPVGKQIAELHRAAYGRTPERGEQLQYVRLRSGFGLPRGDFRSSLDEAYYKGLVQTVLERLDIDWRPTKQVKLFEF